MASILVFFLSNWHVSKKKPKRVPDTLFSLFFFMSYREGPLLACSSRQGSPLLRKALSERGWETPSPRPAYTYFYLFLMAISLCSLKYNRNWCVNNKDHVYILPQFTDLPHLRGEMDSIVWLWAILSKLDKSPQDWALNPTSDARTISEDKHSNLIGTHRYPSIHLDRLWRVQYGHIDSI